MKILAKRSIRGLLNGMGFDIYRIPGYVKNRYGWLRDFRIRTILDVGASTGQFAQEISRFLPDAAIHSFEPVREQYDMLVRGMRSLKRAQAYNLAIGNTNGNIRINRNNFSPSSSILEMTDLAKMAYPYINISEDEEITVRRLDDAILELEINLHPEILLKVDVQGYEGEVIAGGDCTVRNCRVILAEVSFRELYKGQILFDGFYDVMKEKGFSFTGFCNVFCQNDNGMPLYGDAAFLRSR